MYVCWSKQDSGYGKSVQPGFRFLVLFNWLQTPNGKK